MNARKLPAIDYTLRIDGAGNVSWKPIIGHPVPLDQWPGVEFLAYRDERVVWAIERETGVALAAARSRPTVERLLREILADSNEVALRRELKEIFTRCNPGPKPKARWKT